MGIASAELEKEQAKLEAEWKADQARLEKERKKTVDLLNAFIEFAEKTHLDRILRQALLKDGITQWTIESSMEGHPYTPQIAFNVRWPEGERSGEELSFQVRWFPSTPWRPDRKEQVRILITTYEREEDDDQDYLWGWEENPREFGRNLRKKITSAIENPRRGGAYDKDEGIKLIKKGVEKFG